MLKNAHRKSVESVERFPEPLSSGNSLFKSDLPAYRSVDELVTSGNQSFENLDNVDFAGFRNNKELGEETLQKAKEDQVKQDRLGLHLMYFTPFDCPSVTPTMNFKFHNLLTRLLQEVTGP